MQSVPESVRSPTNIGFSKVYHWTDAPSVYSRNFLLLLDPHHSWSRGLPGDPPPPPGGPIYETTEDPPCQEIQNHLQVLKSSFVELDPRVSYDGTIIRLPLRTKSQAQTSKIKSQESTIEEIKLGLQRFAEELRDGGLLFIKSIQKVSMRIDHDVLAETKIVNPDAIK